MSTCLSHLPSVQETLQQPDSLARQGENQEGTTDVTDVTDKAIPSVNSVSSVVPLLNSPDSRSSRGSRRRPPSARDLRMYDRVVVEEVSQYAVAADEKLTQGYVSKRVRRVIEWMGRVGNKEYGAAPANEKLLYLQRFAEKKYGSSD